MKDAVPLGDGQRAAAPMCSLWTLFVVAAAAPLVIGDGYEDAALSRFRDLQGTHSEALNLTLRGKRSSDCDCGEGTSFCFMEKGKKYCECENNILVIDYPCKDCSCVNGICHASSTCRCQTGYGLREDNSCELIESRKLHVFKRPRQQKKNFNLRGQGTFGMAEFDEKYENFFLSPKNETCICGEGLQCYFHEDYQFCNCWDKFISVNTRCSNCKCGEKEVCFERTETRICPCTVGVFIPECDDCDCSMDEQCSYNVTLPNCKCLPQHTRLNGVCTECICEGAFTKCDFVNDTQVCSCKEGFEEHNGTCQECFCGQGHSCTFENGSAVCICNDNYVEHNGTCKECACGEAEICEFVDGKPTCSCKENFLKVGGSCKECFCGVGHDCDIIEGKKICMCKKQFAEKDGICEECQCGAGHDCEFQNAKKVCLCPTGYAEMDGKCVKCSCGNDTACLFSGKEKLCFCQHGYVQKNGQCVEICQEDTCYRGSCQVDGNSFRCNCDIGFGGVLCDEEHAVSKEATILIASLICVTVFWVVLVTACCLRKRKKRYESYRKETLAAGPDDEMQTMTSSPPIDAPE